ncbi:FliM/FliN family flagellar motor switch protein [Telmatospirillum sp.]|uniref:FliM/FliN family flagellar motor switch protein n=1 Tax=Telmatospirillum sp. TaxID=2079197 RepID=UPI002850CA2C|nr:FliM/FliN family flagellar motor switch protein [Telmatospirillum sp.]MDR3438082.1 FliM/FliN family flagellar motor switch protein [Telmatospirillum sp.]
MSDNSVSEKVLSGAVAPNLTQTVIDALPVTVEAVLGFAQVTVADINALQPGQTFTLDTGLGDLVELRLNGIVIATGELVAVGDNFGIRIQHLAPSA